MQQITNQLRIVLLAVARLLWFALRGAWRLLAAGTGYVYRHRVQIVQYKYTLSILMALSVAWAGWRLYAHLQAPAAGAQVVYEAEIASAEAGEPTAHYAVFTNDSSERTGNTALITSVYDWLGTPHRDGGTSKHGTDCSYFVQRVYQEAYGIELNRNSLAMYEEDVRTIAKEDLREGDLVFFNTKGDGISHVGIYLRNNLFVHASTSRGVIVESLESPYFEKNYVASGRVRN
ncbi:MAG: C40 family peptidase [Cytophagales bacterium]|nr:C40 family peptidase [Cytophagales bacterium]